MRWLCLILILTAPGSPALALVKTAHFDARDTLNITPDDDPRAQAMLDGLAWTPTTFQVRAEALVSGDRDAIVSFPSPRPQEDDRQNRVPMGWFAPRDESGAVIEAPAILIVHSLHPDMPFAKTVARELSRRGIHVFIIHMPGYGLRGDDQPTGTTALIHLKQTVADIRRARDAIAALPNIAPGPIAIAGISLGGFAAASAASLDGAFDPVFLMISGVDGYQVLQHGWNDAAAVRRSMARLGYAGDRLRTLLDGADPKYLVHRLDPDRTWLFSAQGDRVIPPASVEALTDRLPLPPDHHIWVPGTHYTAILALPWVIDQIEAVLREEGQQSGTAGELATDERR